MLEDRRSAELGTAIIACALGLTLLPHAPLLGIAAQLAVIASYLHEVAHNDGRRALTTACAIGADVLSVGALMVSWSWSVAMIAVWIIVMMSRLMWSQHRRAHRFLSSTLVWMCAGASLVALILAVFAIAVSWDELLDPQPVSVEETVAVAMIYGTTLLIGLFAVALIAQFAIGVYRNGIERLVAVVVLGVLVGFLPFGGSGRAWLTVPAALVLMVFFMLGRSNKKHPTEFPKAPEKPSVTQRS